MINPSKGHYQTFEVPEWRPNCLFKQLQQKALNEVLSKYLLMYPSNVPKTFDRCYHQTTNSRKFHICFTCLARYSRTFIYRGVGTIRQGTIRQVLELFAKHGNYSPSIGTIRQTFGNFFWRIVPTPLYYC